MGLYISPAATAQQAKDCLEAIRKLNVGPTIISGDFNAKHKAWNQTENTRGKYLAKWVQQGNWSVNAPRDVTFIPSPNTGFKSSTIDLFIGKDLRMEEARVSTGDWEGCSDHVPVTAVVHVAWKMKAGQKTSNISNTRRKNIQLLERAAKSYRDNIPLAITSVQNCDTATALEREMNSIVDILMNPWNYNKCWKPGKPRAAWSRALNSLSKQRSIAYRRARRTGYDTDWKAYKRLDKSIKRKAKRLRERRREVAFEDIANSRVTEATRKLAQISRHRKQNAATATMQGALLDYTEFARFVSTPEGEGYVPELQSFDVPESFELQIVNAIKAAPNGRSAGPDRVFVEAPKSEAKVVGKMLAVVWRKCGELCHMPLQWRKARLVPIHKKGDAKDPRNYRPITIISQLRKIVDKALDAAIREKYNFHPAQLGFRSGVGIENAILRSTRLCEEGMLHTAILDLKKAYDSVPRNKLMQYVTDRIPENEAKMVAYLLQPTILHIETTREGSIQHMDQHLVRIGVPQGDPPSTTLFNIYMDVYAERVMKGESHYRNGDRGLIMFADDVKLSAASPEVLQEMLDTSSVWAADHGMTWSTTKCFILQPDLGREANPTLAGETLRTVREVEYLGVTITNAGITGASTEKRCANAQLQLRNLVSIGLSRKNLSARRTIQLCRALVLPVAEYAIHLTPHTPSVRKKYEMLQAAVLKTSIGSLPERHMARARKLTKIIPHAYRATLLLDKLNKRLKQNAQKMSEQSRERAIAEGDIHSLGIHRRRCNIPPECREGSLNSMWGALCKTAARPIPNMKEPQTPPILSSRNPRTRHQGIRWYFNKFPPQTVATRSLQHRQRRKTATYMRAVEMLRANMRKVKWTEGERAETERAIEMIATVDAQAEAGRAGNARKDSSKNLG